MAQPAWHHPRTSPTTRQGGDMTMMYTPWRALSARARVSKIRFPHRPSLFVANFRQSTALVNSKA